MKLIIHFDGGAAPTNPGHSAFGFTVDREENHVITRETARSGYLGVQTNNFAEYTGFIEGAKYASNTPGLTAVDFIGDSKLVVEQINRRWAVKSEAVMPLWAQAIILVEALADRGVIWSATWVPRAKNPEPDALCTFVIDRARKNLPQISA